MPEIYHYKNTHQLILDELTDSDGNYVNDATVSASIKDDDGNELESITMSYESGSNGKYKGNISYSLSVSIGDVIWAEITAVDGSSYGFWRVKIIVQHRD